MFLLRLFVFHGRIILSASNFLNIYLRIFFRSFGLLSVLGEIREPDWTAPI